ncbi:hypothetical protein, partial [Neisseria sicca]|uniref:hypothetical protein n=1 Tax=Neisseria sicca TaxID=490 RepID=UPI003F68B414
MIHYLKLHHFLDEKIHAPSTPPYTLLTQHPFRPKPHFPPQPFPHIHLSPLQPYPPPYTLQHIFTLNSHHLTPPTKI